MIRTLVRTLALLAGLTGASPLISGFDLPLMPGLAEQPDTRVNWDKAEGRILETVLEGEAPPEDVRHYYTQAAQGLGWTPEADPAGRVLLFHRGTDQLTIDAIARGPRVTVRLLLEPSGR